MCSIAAQNKMQGELMRNRVELIDDECYKFEHPHVDCRVLGLYNTKWDIFIVGNVDYQADDCTNITLMKEA